MAERYFEPETVGEAVRILAEEADGVAIIAGGTDLVVGARSGKSTLPAVLVAIHRVSELTGIARGEDGTLRLGALVSHALLERAPLLHDGYNALSDAAALVGSPATRHLGTLGGNLCNASPAMETGSPLLVLDAAVELASAEGDRIVPLAEFLEGPGRTTLARGELLTAVVAAPLPAGRVGSAYARLEYRQAMEIAVVGAAALVALDGEGCCAEARLALTAVAPTCVRATEAESLLRGQVLTATLLGEAGQVAARASRPIDDVRAPASYRRAMVAVIVRRALERALERARGEGCSPGGVP